MSDKVKEFYNGFAKWQKEHGHENEPLVKHFKETFKDYLKPNHDDSGLTIKEEIEKHEKEERDKPK